MSCFKLRGYFIKREHHFYATIPCLALSQENSTIDGALEKILSALREIDIKVKLTLIEGNGFTIESANNELEQLILEKISS